MNRYQKGKTNLNFTEASDSEWQWHQLGHMQVCNSLQTDNHASTQQRGISAVVVCLVQAGIRYYIETTERMEMGFGMDASFSYHTLRFNEIRISPQ